MSKSKSKQDKLTPKVNMSSEASSKKTGKGKTKKSSSKSSKAQKEAGQKVSGTNSKAKKESQPTQKKTSPKATKSTSSKTKKGTPKTPKGESTSQKPTSETSGEEKKSQAASHTEEKKTQKSSAGSQVSKSQKKTTPKSRQKTRETETENKTEKKSDSNTQKKEYNLAASKKLKDPETVTSKTEESKGWRGKIGRVFSKRIEKMRGWPAWVRIITALLVTGLIIGLLVFTAAYLQSESFRRRVQGKNPVQVSLLNQGKNIEKEVQGLQETLQATNPDNLLKETVNLRNLDVYPQPWVEKYFSATEQQNSLISGPNGDADGDGLTNKREFFYASDPRNPYTMCGELVPKEEAQQNENKKYCYRNDKENVENGINPLTGLETTANPTLEIERQNRGMVEELEDTISQASKEGVNYPKVYALSRTVDFSEEVKKIELQIIEDKRNNLLDYLDKRAQVLGNLAGEDPLNSFFQSYKLSNPRSIRQLLEKYKTNRDEFQEMAVPSRYEKLHRLTVYSMQQNVELLKHRLQGIKEGKIETKEYRKKSEKKAINMIWGFRKLTEESNRVQEKLENEEIFKSEE